MHPKAVRPAVRRRGMAGGRGRAERLPPAAPPLPSSLDPLRCFVFCLDRMPKPPGMPSATVCRCAQLVNLICVIFWCALPAAPAHDLDGHCPPCILQCPLHSALAECDWLRCLRIRIPPQLLS